MASQDSATTTVKAPRSVRVRMAALERLSPSRAAVIAERLWFQVPPAPTPGRLEKFTPTGGAPFFLMCGRSEITGATFGPDDAPIAFLVHGWGGYWQQLGKHVPTLLEAGYRVVAWDAPSHGRSTHGDEGFGSGSVLEMADAVNAVAAEFGSPTLLVAHSIGAMAAMRASRTGQLPEGYVFIAPEVRLEPAIEWFETVVGMGPRTREIFLDRLHRRIGIDLSDFDLTQDVRRLAEQDSLPPLLAVHDRDDPDTPASETEALVRQWPDAELMITSSLGHRQVIWHDEVVRRVAEFAGSLAETRGGRRLRDARTS